MEKENKQEFYTKSEVAKLLGISRTTVYTYIKVGKLKVKTIGNKQYIHKNEIFKD